MNTRVVLPLVLLGVLCYLLVLFQHILLPFILAATISYALNPLIVYFEMRGVRRERAVLVTYTLLLLTFVAFAYLGISAAVQSTSSASVEMPQYLHQAKSFGMHLGQYPWLQRLGVSEWVRNQIVEDGRDWILKFIETAPTLFRLHILPLVEMAFLIPFLTFFFMHDGPRFIEGIVDLIPGRYVEMFLNMVVEINYSFGNYLRGLLLQAFFMGVLVGIGYGVIGLHYAVYIALWAAAASMIPYFGPISAATAAAIIALFQWGTLAGLLKVLIVFIVIRAAEDWLLQPLILRRAVHIHPVVSVFALMAGAYMAGVWGLLFAIPGVCMLKVLFEVSWQWYRIEYGLRTKSIPPEANQIPVV